MNNALCLFLDSHQLDLALSMGFADNQLWLTTPKHQACLIGPASVDLDINSAVYRTHPPTSSLMLSAGVIPVKLGNESISLTAQCVKDVLGLIPKKVCVSLSLVVCCFSIGLIVFLGLNTIFNCLDYVSDYVHLGLHIKLFWQNC